MDFLLLRIVSCVLISEVFLSIQCTPIAENIISDQSTNNNDAQGKNLSSHGPQKFKQTSLFKAGQIVKTVV